MSALIAILALLYPMIVQLSVNAGHASIAIYYLIVLLLLPTLHRLIQRRRLGIGRSAALLLVVTALLLAPQEYDQTVVMLAPVPLYSALSLFFFSTLRPGKTPLITRIASMMRDDMPPEVVVYTRRVTLAWALFFCGMALITLLLVLYAPFSAWSFFTSRISYSLVASMFLLEFALRYWLLKRHMNYSMMEFASRLVRLDYNKVFRQ